MRDARFVIALVATATALVGAGAASAQERARAFAGVPFGARPATVREAMLAARLAPSIAPTVADGSILDQRFEGRWKGQEVLVTASYDAGGGLEKVLVSFLTPDEECVAFYRALKKELRRKYGAPVTDYERWDFPYDKGGHVGHEHDAIRIGKGTLVSVWEDADAGSTEGGIVMATGENVIVRLAYESSKWGTEAARRKKILDALPEPESATTTPPAPGRSPRSGSTPMVSRQG